MFSGYKETIHASESDQDLSESKKYSSTLFEIYTPTDLLCSLDLNNLRILHPIFSLHPRVTPKIKLKLGLP